MEAEASQSPSFKVVPARRRIFSLLSCLRSRLVHESKRSVLYSKEASVSSNVYRYSDQDMWNMQEQYFDRHIHKWREQRCPSIAQVYAIPSILIFIFSADDKKRFTAFIRFWLELIFHCIFIERLGLFFSLTGPFAFRKVKSNDEFHRNWIALNTVWMQRFASFLLHAFSLILLKILFNEMYPFWTYAPSPCECIKPAHFRRPINLPIETKSTSSAS